MNIKYKFLLLKKKSFFNILKNGLVSRKCGVNFSGKKTVRNRGFLAKKKKRSIDYYRAFWHVLYLVVSFEYDPNRNTLVNCIQYFNVGFSYIVSLSTLKLGTILMDGNFVKLKLGASTVLKCIPKSFKLSNIENNLFKGSKLVRSSSTSAKLLNKNKLNAFLVLPSKKLKKVNIFCTASLGSVFNFDFNFGKYKKASYYRYKGFRPKVRGVAMNPIDHPHGGGEGKKSKKMNPMSVWGKSLIFKKNYVKR